METFATLYLEINKKVVEVIRVFGKDHCAVMVMGLKSTYCLEDYDDYEFYLLVQSKMNPKK
jgi:hypothetical protein